MHAQIEATIRACERFIATRDDSLNLPRDAAEFLRSLIWATRARSVLEVGTSYGYSGLWIGLALADTGGTMTTIDIDPAKSATARQFFEQAGLVEIVNCVTGPAAKVLARWDQPVDFVLLDADKQNCRAYTEQILPHLRDGGVILTDNTTSHDEELADFVAWIRAHDELISSQVPIGNGMELTVRNAADAHRDTIELQVLFFGPARAAAGTGQTTLSVPADATSTAVRRLLAERFPGLPPAFASWRLAVNRSFVADDFVVGAGDEVAVIPPVSGG